MCNKKSCETGAEGPVMNNGESELELSRIESTVANQNEAEQRPEPITCRERINRIRKFITVEPFLAIYAISNALSYVASQKFITERECLVDLNFTREICYKIVEGIEENSTLFEEHKDQFSVAIGALLSWKLPLEKFVPAILVLNIGAWSDRTGNRKAIIIVPIIGQVLSAGCYLLGVFVTNMPIWVISLLDAVVLTITGGFSVLLTGVYCYVADATEAEMRTQKLAVIGVTSTVSSIVGVIIAGELTHSCGYAVPLGSSLLCSIFGIMYTYFKIHDVNRKGEEGTVCKKIVNFLHPKNFWESFSLLALSKGKKFVQIVMIVSGFIIITGPTYGLLNFVYNYLLIRYNMNEVQYTWFDSIVQAIVTIGTVIGVKLFTDKLKVHDCLLGVISTLCRFVSYLIYAFAPNKFWLYTGAATDLFGGLSVIVLRSLSTKIVDSGDIGKLSSIISFTDALVGVIANPLYNQVWVQYQGVFKGAPYLLACILTIPNFFIMFWLYYIDKKQQRDIVTDPQAKERHVYDNEITQL